MQRAVAIIPARYASTRFPGKPLAMLDGRMVIERVYRQAKSQFEYIFVATDDERIYRAVEAFGGRAVMTGSNHRSGTDRCFEAYQKSGVVADVVINIQGDEPFVHQTQLSTLLQLFDCGDTEIATLVKPFSKDATFEQLSNPNSPKVIIDSQNNALYFSRSVVPYLRGVDTEEWALHHTYYKHIGLYGYRTDVLEQITKLQPSALERAESLEQLRWLSAGYNIKVGYTDIETIGIDTPSDLVAAENFLKSSR